MRGRIKMQASGKDSLVSAWNLFWGSGNLIPRLTFCVPLDFVNGKKITLWPLVKTVWINLAYLLRALKNVEVFFQLFQENCSPGDSDHYGIWSIVACRPHGVHLNHCAEIANHKQWLISSCLSHLFDFRWNLTFDGTRGSFNSPSAELKIETANVHINCTLGLFIWSTHSLAEMADMDDHCRKVHFMWGKRT